MTVRELEHRMTPTEFNRWQIFWNIMPFGPHRDAHFFGQVCSTIASVMTGKRFKSTDFFPLYEPRNTATSLKPADGKPFTIKQRNFMTMFEGIGKPKEPENEGDT